jgi:hypothetical protein
MKQKERVLQQQVNCLNYFENRVGAFNMSKVKPVFNNHPWDTQKVAAA